DRRHAAEAGDDPVWDADASVDCERQTVLGWGLLDAFVFVLAAGTFVYGDSGLDLFEISDEVARPARAQGNDRRSDSAGCGRDLLSLGWSLGRFLELDGRLQLQRVWPNRGQAPARCSFTFLDDHQTDVRS